ncbi:MAG: hypothetical protein ACO3ND_09255 [Opitutales bacterium]
MNWSWLLLLLATYPWLVASDLITDTLSDSGLVCFLAAAAMVAPSRRLGRGAAAIFALCIGFMFESRRPLPDGSVAFPLAFAAIALSGPQTLMRRPAQVWIGAIILNALATLVWVVAAGSHAWYSGHPLPAGHLVWRGLLQVTVSAAAAALLAPFMLRAQESIMNRLGIPEAREG